ncbi:MAG TPA: hypothetical protein VF647_12160 [Longimicrobium sp.]
MPPARFTATPHPPASFSPSATLPAQMVAPAERRERSTIPSLHGKPIRRCSRYSSRPSRTRST